MTLTEDPEVEGQLRELAPQVLGVLVRRHGQFEACEDAVQEALLDAATQWCANGVPDNPRGWLLTVAHRRLTDLWRSESSRRRREEAAAALDRSTVPAVELGPEALMTDDSVFGSAGSAGCSSGRAGYDDTLQLLFLCCHPELTTAAQVALTLRAVGGLTTAQIGAAFLVPEATVGQRISRAKQRIKGRSFGPPLASEGDSRLTAVLQVLYLIFNEGYAASSGEHLQRSELTTEATRLTRMLRQDLPDDAEVAGLLALMLLTDARRAARTGHDGRLVPLAEQDRRLWSQDKIAEGTALISANLAVKPPGPYQLQAAIAAVHAEADNVADTDWRQILGLYRVLATIAPSPMVTLNQAVALAMVDGPSAGLALLSTLDGSLGEHHRLAAVRAHLLEQSGQPALARAAYLRAAQRTTSLPERHYLESRAAQLR